MAYSEIPDILIAGMASAVPENILDLENLENRFGREAIDVARVKYGTAKLRVSLQEQTASDLGFAAASQIMEKKGVDPADVGAIVFASLTPDYRSPATATVLHYRLGLSVDCIAFDMVLGCNGFIYGLQAVSSLLTSINKPYALLITGDTTSKLLSENNPLSSLYGDGAAAILLEKKTGAGTIAADIRADGRGFGSIIIPGGGFRFHHPLSELKENIYAGQKKFNELNMDEQVFEEFVLAEIPAIIHEFISKRNLTPPDFDFLAMHQSGSGLLEKLAEKLGLKKEHLPSNISTFGNTSGNSIPLLLCDTFGKTENKEVRVLACAFGEGFSWGVADFHIQASDVLPVIETNDFFHEGEVSHIF